MKMLIRQVLRCHLALLLILLLGPAKDCFAMRTELPPAASGAMYACWHIVSVFLLWSCFVFWRGGKSAFHFGLLWIASAIVFL